LKTLGRIFINVLSAGLLLGAIGVVGVFFAVWFFGRDLPDHQKLAAYEPPIVSRVYAGDGRLIGEFSARRVVDPAAAAKAPAKPGEKPGEKIITERRVYVPYNAIPKRVVHAFVAAEDQRFFSHTGVDAFGLVRAAWTNIKAYGSGRRLVGGSTITQQVAKNMLLSSEKSFERKIKEMILSFRIEGAIPKERILELYLNEIFLGRTAYGVAAAAQVYFGKALDELTVAEAAFLGGLPQAPSRYNPQRNLRVATARRNYVIGRMLEDGYITKAEADAAMAAPLTTLPNPPFVSAGAEYFAEEVRRELLLRYGEEKMNSGGFVVRSTLDPRLQKFADEALRKGLVEYDRRHGWRGAVTNMREGKGERWADNWRRKLAAVPPVPGAGDWSLALVLNVDDQSVDIGTADGKRGRIPLAELLWARKQGEVPIEPGKPTFKTATGPAIRKAGEVLALGDVILVEPVKADERGKAYPADTYALRQIPDVNGAIVVMDPHTGRVLAMTGGFSFWLSQFNTATQALRQPGSAFKSFVYQAALEAGCTPSTIVLDAPVVVKFGTRIYRPRNASGKFSGPTPMRVGLEQSKNLMTIRLADAVGLERVAELAKKMGVADNLEPEMAMALGAYETTPLRMAAAYALFVNGGKKIVPTVIDRVQDRHGKIVFRHDGRECRQCAEAGNWRAGMPDLPDTREQILDEDNAYQIVSMLQGAVLRGTGTAVAVLGRPVAGKTGTTNDVLDAWFVGFTPNLVVAVWVGFDKPRTLGFREQGGVTAAPIFRDFMKEALKGTPVEQFRVPKGVVNVGGEWFKKGHEPGKGPGCAVGDSVTADEKGGGKPKPAGGIGETY
jgi:penicillin-binding protein 1A